MKLSIVIPVYNEEKTIKKILEIVKKAPLPKNMERELVVINDCSKDNTKKILDTINDPEIKIYHSKKNHGKGGALHAGFKKATGELIIIQDADMEYDPNEYGKLLKPILEDRADIVYGSRFLGEASRSRKYLQHTLANKFLTILSNFYSGLHLTDMETCYKVIKKDILKKIKLKEKRFGIEPEITAKLAKLVKKDGLRIVEVPISYFGRSYHEGKKIGWKDALQAISCIIRYNTKN